MGVGSCLPLETLDEYNDQMAPCQEAASEGLALDKTPCLTVPGQPL